MFTVFRGIGGILELKIFRFPWFYENTSAYNHVKIADGKT
jgi:hypothetical protein